MNKLEKFDQQQVKRLAKGKELPDFAPGDTICVNVKIIEGTTERIQAYEGTCIGRKNRGVNSSFTVRKISHGEGVERVFPLYSPRIDSVEIVRKGDVRRAKLYYLRDLAGKAARIKEDRVLEAELASAEQVTAEQPQETVATEQTLEAGAEVKKSAKERKAERKAAAQAAAKKKGAKKK